MLDTGGPVERRGTDLDDGTAWLVRRFAGLAGTPLEQLCEHLLGDAPAARDDDVAVLAVRVGRGVQRIDGGRSASGTTAVCPLAVRAAGTPLNL